MDLLLLFFKLELLVTNEAHQSLKIRLSFSQLVLCNLKVGFRSQTHVGDLVEACLVLLLNLTNFLLCVVIDLIHHFLVVTFHGLNGLLKMSDLLLLLVDSILVVLLLLIHLFSVLLIDCRLSITELPCFLLLLFLQSLVASSILKHALRVLVTSSFELLVVLLLLHLQLLFKLVFNFILVGLKLFNLAADHQLLA